MAYVEGQTVHDADSHVMELPGQLDTYVEPGAAPDQVLGSVRLYGDVIAQDKRFELIERVDSMHVLRRLA